MNATAIPAGGASRPATAEGQQRPLPLLLLIAYPLLVAQLFIYHTHFFDVYLTGLRIPGVLYLLFVLTTLASGLLLGAMRTTVSKVWLVFLGWALVSSALGIWRSNSLVKLYACLQSLSLFWGIVALTVNSRLLLLNMKLIGFFAMISSILGLYFVTAGNERLAYYRGTFADANEYSIWLMLGLLALWLSMASSKSVLMKLVYFAMCAPILWAMLKTGSRGSLMALLVLFISAFLAASANRKVGVLLFCLLGSSSFFFLPDNLKDRYMTILSSSPQSGEAAERLLEATESRAGRLELLWRSLDATLRHPLLGVGPDNFGTYNSDAIKRERGTNAPSFTTHNTYTQISSEMGLPGLMIFLSILWIGIRDMNRVIRSAKLAPDSISNLTLNCAYYLRLALIGIGAGSFFLSLGYSTIYYILMGLITACTQLANQEIEGYEFRRKHATALLEPAAPRKAAVRVSLPLPVQRNPIKLGRMRTT
jgi:O-antigen ligase